jgi:hypothetical protein
MHRIIKYIANHILTKFVMNCGCARCPLSDQVICHILSHLHIGEYLSRICPGFSQNGAFFRSMHQIIKYIANYILTKFVIYCGCAACPLSDQLIRHILCHLHVGEYLCRNCPKFSQNGAFFRSMHRIIKYIANNILTKFVMNCGCATCPLSDQVICHILSHLHIGE